MANSLRNGVLASLELANKNSFGAPLGISSSNILLRLLVRYRVQREAHQVNLGIVDQLIARIATKRAFTLPKTIEGNFVISQIYQQGEKTFLHLPVRDATVLVGKMSMFADTRRKHSVVEFTEIITSGVESFAVYEVLEAVSGEFGIGDRVWLSGWLNSASNLSGLQYEKIEVAPNFHAQFIDAASDDWVIHVHGWNASVHETSRTFRGLKLAGYKSISVAWPSDIAPWGSGERVCNYGATESQVLVRAIELARAKGARRIFLFGYSMGTALIANYLATHGTSEIAGVVLDSPLVDLRHTLISSMLRLKVNERRIELSLALGQKRFAAMSSSFEQLSYACLEPMPRTLVFYATNDEFLDMNPVSLMHSAHPQKVQTVSVESAGHCRTFNQDPEKYLAQLLSFLSAVQ